MAEVELWFPVAIYHELDLFPSDRNKQWKDYAFTLKEKYPSGSDGWVGDVYTTHGTYDIVKDENFKDLIDEITKHVNNFARSFNCQKEFMCNSAWLNINDKDHFQEYHHHAGQLFSAVYYIEAPEGSGNLVFEDPKEPDMFPLPNITEKNSLSFQTCDHTPITGKLIIFRSYMRHLVEKGTNTTPRVSVACNFN